MKLPVPLLLIVLFCSCESSNDFKNLRSENNALQQKVASLEAEVGELKRSPGEVINDVKNKFSNGDLIAAKQNLVKIISSQLSNKQLNDTRKLLSAINNKLEESDYKNLSGSDTSLYNDFIHNYPKSRYAAVLKKKIKKLRQVQEVQPNYSSSARHYRKKSYSSNYGTTRVGAICCDGTRSYATGRGACSHHGGVCQWLYQ